MALSVVLMVAGLLQVLLAARMWSGSSYRATPWLLTIFPYGSQLWTMPIPVTCNGVVFATIGALLVLPRALISLDIAVMVVVALIEVVVAVWQPKWADPPSLRREL